MCLTTRLLTQAASLAKANSEFKNYSIACIALRQDGVFVQSYNGSTKLPMPAAHAEAKVLKKAGRGAILFVARVTADGEWALSKPCKNCSSLIRSKLVERVYYTIAPGEFGVWDL